jgi:hypothetical protein
MTNPFQSITGTQGGALGLQSERDERNASTEALAEEVKADELPSLNSRPDEIPSGMRIAPALFDRLFSIDEVDPAKRKPLRGDTYPKEEALALLNSHFFIGRNNQETAIFRINDDESATFIPPEQFKLEVQNIFVKSSGSAKPVPAEKFWRESAQRHERKIVFKPGGTTTPDEFNQWAGFGVKPRKGWQKQRRLLRHIREVICRRERKKFKYLIRYLAWAVQHPDKHSGVVIVLKSRKQGTGKSTLGKVMLDIFGPHGALIDDKERLLGRFTDWLETTCFVVAEEILWAGDHKAADKLKSVITGDTIQIERKFGSCRQVPNRLKTIATTNHDHAIAAGVQDRRNAVYDVSDERVADKAWFDGLYRDLDAGGTSEFLHFLQSVRLGEWHPRQILKTPETIEQQRMSGDSVSQWSQACINAEVIGAERGPYGLDATQDLGTPISFETLYKAYGGFCKQNGQRALSTEAFGKACADMFGPRQRLRALQSNTTGGSKRRPWGYHIPKGKKWQEKVDGRLGIKT